MVLDERFMSNQQRVSANMPPTKQRSERLPDAQPDYTTVVRTPSRSHSLLQLQKKYGNYYVQRMVESLQGCGDNIDVVLNPSQSALYTYSHRQPQARKSTHSQFSLVQREAQSQPPQTGKPSGISEQPWIERSQKRLSDRLFSSTEIDAIGSFAELPPSTETRELLKEEADVLHKLDGILEKIFAATNHREKFTKKSTAIFERGEETLEVQKDGLIVHSYRDKKMNLQRHSYDATGAKVEGRWLMEYQIRQEEREAEAERRVSSRLFNKNDLNRLAEIIKPAEKLTVDSILRRMSGEELAQKQVSEAPKYEEPGVHYYYTVPPALGEKEYEKQAAGKEGIAFWLRDPVNNQRPIEVITFTVDGLLCHEQRTYKDNKRLTPSTNEISCYDKTLSRLKVKTANALKGEEAEYITENELESLKEPGSLTAMVLTEITSQKDKEPDPYKQSAGVEKQLKPFFDKVFKQASINVSTVEGIDAQAAGELSETFKGVRSEFERHFYNMYMAHYDPKGGIRTQSNKVDNLADRIEDLADSGKSDPTLLAEFTKEHKLLKKMKNEAYERVRMLTSQATANQTAAAICFVASHYLYAKFKRNEKRSFENFFLDELKMGHIGLESQQSDAKPPPFKEFKKIEFPYFGLQTDIALTELPMTPPKGKRPNRPLLQAEIDQFLATGEDMAIAYKPAPHFFLIVKDKNGVWRNLDHTDKNPEWRGGETDFHKIWRLNWDSKERQEQANKATNSLKQESQTPKVNELIKNANEQVK